MTLNRNWQEDGWLGPLDLTLRPMPAVVEVVGRGGKIKQAGRPARVEILGGLGGIVTANAPHLRDIAARCTAFADALDRIAS